MNNIALSDAMFLLAESGGRPAQVVTLQLYKPPADADPQAWVTDYFHQLMAAVSYTHLTLPTNREV